MAPLSSGCLRGWNPVATRSRMNDGLRRYSLAGLEYCGAVGADGERVALGLRLWESLLVPLGIRH
jgi:hypothetical protein